MTYEFVNHHIISNVYTTKYHGSYTLLQKSVPFNLQLESFVTHQPINQLSLFQLSLNFNSLLFYIHKNA